MDVPPDAGVGASGPERLVPAAPARVTPAEVAERLEVVEAQLTDLGARLDALSASLPNVVQGAVADEVRAMSGELRHTVSQLGRLLVRDLGRLSQILAEHRDTIVAELRVAPQPSDPSPTPDPAATPQPDGGAEAEDGSADLVEDSEEVESGDDPAAGNDEESEDRTWLRRRRAR